MIFKLIAAILILAGAVLALIGGATEADLLAISATVIGGAVAALKFVKK